MSFQDRPYQIDAVNSIWDYFQREAGNPLIIMPTGTGKSVVIARFLESVFNIFGNQKILILTHVKELIQQNYSKLKAMWPFAPAGIYSAGLGVKDYIQNIIFAGIQSVVKKASLFGKVDLVIIDEAHLVSPNDDTMYHTFLSALRNTNPALKVIGLTATGWRMGHGRLIDPKVNKKGQLIPSLFTDVCYDLSTLENFNKLIDDGYLIPLVPKPTSTIFDVTGLHMLGGDYKESEMQERFDKEEITEAALREAMEAAKDRKKWLIFASGTDHADNVGAMLNSFGIETGVVHSKRADRDETIKAFKEGRLRAIVNNNVLTTGFDDPEIDCIIILRATASSSLWVQMLGRGTRPVWGVDGKGDGHDLNTREGRFAAIAASGKISCLVLDYARNTGRLGCINDPVIPKLGKGIGGTAPVKMCEVCDTYNHASARYCGGQPYQTALGCGAEFSFETKFKETAATDDLIRGDMPIVEVFQVDHISCDPHNKVGKPPSVRVSYYCRLRTFTEYVCIEHQDWAGRQARKWWAERTNMPFPESTNAALEVIDRVKAPTHLRVWTNKDYPQIMAFCYDGTAFGTKDMDEFVPDIQSRAKKAATHIELEDDDVPF